MKVAYTHKNASVIEAPITDVGATGFTAIASTGSIDRDQERIQPGAFNPRPASIKVHADHTFTVDRVIGVAKPYYRGAELCVDVTLGSGSLAQDTSAKMIDGLVDSVSVVFTGAKWEAVDGIRTCTSAELVACDVVTVPSNRDARILSVRGFRSGARGVVAEARLQALLALAEVEIAEAERTLKSAYLAEARHLLRDL